MTARNFSQSAGRSIWGPVSAAECGARCCRTTSLLRITLARGQRPFVSLPSTSATTSGVSVANAAKDAVCSNPMLPAGATGAGRDDQQIIEVLFHVELLGRGVFGPTHQTQRHHCAQHVPAQTVGTQLELADLVKRRLACHGDASGTVLSELTQHPGNVGVAKAGQCPGFIKKALQTPVELLLGLWRPRSYRQVRCTCRQVARKAFLDCDRLLPVDVL